MTILENVLPTNLDFYRTPTPASAPKRVSPSISANSVVSTQDRNLAQTSERMGIYGSVSTSDIAANLKAILAEDEASSRVVLSAEDIQFVQETDDKDRVKHLGVFEIEIRVEGATDSVRRTIKVNAQD
jgi:ribosomal protein L9